MHYGYLTKKSLMNLLRLNILNLNITNTHTHEDTNEALVLDTLVEESLDNIEKEKFTTSKSKENLSPSVRKIIKEVKW